MSYINYKITSLEKKITSKGEISKVSLSDVNGTETKGVTIWPTFPGYASLSVGSLVTGMIETKQNGQYTNKTLKEERTEGFTKGTYKEPWKTTGIKAAQERKEEMIEKAQERKNDSIAYFNSINSAIAYWQAKDMDFGLQDVFDVRDKFLQEWHKYEADPQKKDPVPVPPKNW